MPTYQYRFFFHYSGHGGRVKDTDGDEDDGYDETIYPVDFQQYEGESGQIVDDVSISSGSRYKVSLTHSSKCTKLWCVPYLEVPD